MIFVGKTPYRISLLGGGTDLDWFAEENKYGLSLGYSLEMYSYSVIKKLSSTSKYGIINYSTRETYQNNDDIVHPLIREALKLVNLNFLIELSTFGSASGGSGLGGSSSFLISLLSALSNLINQKWSKELLAKRASDIEIKKLLKPIGRQDHYLSAIGGISSLEFNAGGSVIVKKISKEKETLLRRLISNFYLVPTNTSRSADSILSSIKNDPSSKEDLCNLREIAKNFISTQEKRDHMLEIKFHESVQDSWNIKKNMSSVMNSNLTEQYDYLNKNIPNNWIRLLGAGGGGFFLVSLKDQNYDITSLECFNKLGNICKASISETGTESRFF